MIPVLSTKQCCCGWFVLFHFVPTCEIPIKVEVPLKKKYKHGALPLMLDFLLILLAHVGSVRCKRFMVVDIAGFIF